MKIRPVGAELFHVDGRTDTTKLIDAIRNFANVPHNETPTCYNISKHASLRLIREVYGLILGWVPDRLGGFRNNHYVQVLMYTIGMKCLKYRRKYMQPIPVAIRSKDLVYSRLTAGIAGSKIAEGTDVVSRFLCVV